MYDKIGFVYEMQREKSMMASSHGNAFRITGPLWGESTGHRWIPRTKDQKCETLAFPVSCWLEQTAKQTTELQMILLIPTLTSILFNT